MSQREVGKLVQKYCDAIAENYASEGFKRVTVKVFYTRGRKYFKVTVRQYLEGKFNNACSLAFVDFKGNVYRDRGGKKKYDLNDPKCILFNSRFADWAGFHLYM